MTHSQELADTINREMNDSENYRTAERAKHTDRMLDRLKYELDLAKFEEGVGPLPGARPN